MKKNRSKQDSSGWPQVQMRLFRMVSVGVVDEPVNTAYDILSIGSIVANLAATICNTFDTLSASWGWLFHGIEVVTVFFFALDYVLRLLTAPCLYPGKSRGRAAFSYIISAAGVIDILSFLPYYLPVFFPSGLAVFRMFRVIRILRLFRINAYYDQLNVITEVLQSKKQQLMASVFIILVLMLSASLCMYSLEHEAQPEAFANAFSGIWWAAAALLTVGYGDIYPITTLGKLFGILITFLGVGMVAIPTGIISAGFVEQYQRYKRIGDYEIENQIRFVKVTLRKRDLWCARQIKDLGLPSDIIIAAVERGGKVLIPQGDLILLAGDTLTIGAEPPSDDTPIELKEVQLGRGHNWINTRIADLDLSRRSVIVMVRRAGTMLVPRGDLELRKGDVVYIHKVLKRSSSDDDMLV